MTTRVGWSPGPASWTDDLTPISSADWSYDRAAHLLTHAGFGGTPKEVETLADQGLDGVSRPLAVVRERGALDGAPDVVVVLGQHFFARLGKRRGCYGQ